MQDRKTGFSAWWMIAVLGIFYVLSIIDRMILTMLVSPIKADLGLNDIEIGLILGPAFAVCYALFGLPLGWAADRLQRRWVVFAGVAFWGLATVLAGMASNFHGLLLARMGVGIGEAALTPAAYSLIADRFPRERLTTAISVYHIAPMVGGAFAFGVGGWMISVADGLRLDSIPILGSLHPWQIVLIAVGIPAFPLAFLVFTFAEPPRQAFTNNIHSSGTPLMSFIASEWRRLLLIALAFAMIALTGYSLAAWTPTYLERAFAMQPAQYGGPMALVNFLSGATLILNGVTVDYFAARGVRNALLRVYMVLILITLPAIPLVFWTSSPYLFMAINGIAMLTFVPFMVYVSSLVALIAPSDLRGRVNAGFLAIFTIIGLGGGPLLVGFLTEYVFGEARLNLALMAIGIVGLTVALICTALLSLLAEKSMRLGKG